MHTDARFYHLRTYDNKEVDLLIELADGYPASEIRMKDLTVKQDTRYLATLGEILDKPVIHSFLLTNDPESR